MKVQLRFELDFYKVPVLSPAPTLLRRKTIYFCSLDFNMFRFYEKEMRPWFFLIPQKP
jgi:hypothetical protein